MVLNRPRVDLLWRNWVPPLLPVERQRERFPILYLQTCVPRTLAGTGGLAEEAFAAARPGEETAKRLGIGLNAIHAAIGRLDMPLLPPVYDAIGLLDLPDKGPS